MPQDVPYEASETLAFTPDCLSGLSNPPVFTLRAATAREKRIQRRLMNEEGAIQHSTEVLRKELLAALKPLWGEEKAAEFTPIIEAYWQEFDHYQQQLPANPDLKWEYDEAIERSMLQLEDDIAQAWKPYARMRSDNAWATEISYLALAAVVVSDWTGITADKIRDRGYFTVDAMSEVREELIVLDRRAGNRAGTAWGQLIAACLKRMYLDKEEEGNSESPSPSDSTPPASKTAGKGSRRGKSQASASSAKTQETA